MVVHAVNLSTWTVETGESLVRLRPTLIYIMSSRIAGTTGDPVLKQNKTKNQSIKNHSRLHRKMSKHDLFFFLPFPNCSVAVFYLLNWVSCSQVTNLWGSQKMIVASGSLQLFHCPLKGDLVSLLALCKIRI